MARRSLPVIPPELRDEGVPGGAMSYSKYTKFKGCGADFEFTYVKGLRGPPSGNMARGVAVHAGAELALKGKKAGKAVSVSEAVNAVSESLDADGFPEEKDVAIALYRVYHAIVLPKVVPLAIEEEFVVKVGTVTTVGYIDLVDGAQGADTVVDLKTSSAKWSEREVRLDTQLTLYAAVRGTASARIDNLVSTKTPAYHGLPTTRTSQDVKIFIEDFEETVDFIKRGVFPKAPIDSWKCDPKWCGHWSVCRGRKL